MYCPQCKGYSLEPRELEPGLIAGVCPKCSGTLLALMNYRYWSDQHFQAHAAATHAEKVEAVDGEHAKQCPKCSRLMNRFRVGLDTNNRIDLCEYCDEAWLDKGEWLLLKSLDLADKLPRIFTDAWQRNIRLERQQRFMKDKYEALLGAEDFARVDVFKQWLDQHPEREQIKLYLGYAFKH